MTREEAISEIKSWDFLEGKEIEAIHTLIPELRESDDERIRKEIKDIVLSYRNNCVYEGNHHFDECLAYLEKQKEPYIAPVPTPMVADEQKPVECIDFYDEFYKIYTGPKNILAYVNMFVKKLGYIPIDIHELSACVYYVIKHIEEDTKAMQKGQKPVDYDAELKKCKDNPLYFFDKYVPIKQMSTEWSEEDDEIRKALIAFLEMNTGYFACDGFTKDDIIQWLKSLRLQPKQEWSDEDEKMLAGISYKISQHQGNDERSLFTPDEAEFICGMEDKFKSLCPQSKKELSIEKAIKWLDDTFCFLDNSSGRGRDCEITTHDFDSLEEMYDSFRKAVIVDSEPHWKPSEEQMAALRRALHINPANGKLHELKENEVYVLQSLLRELEKL